MVGYNVEKRINILAEKIGSGLEGSLTHALYGFVEAIIGDYRKSDDFGEDACRFCREAGWREPE